MGVTVSYNALVNRLERELSISVTTTENPTKFKRKLSQAKHRMAVEGKLIFADSSQMQMIDGVEVEVFCISVALNAKKSTVKILTLNENGGL